LARFQREAEAIARLQHPHIVQVYEVGEHEGFPFFSLEFCPGGSLENKLSGTPLPPREAAGLVEVLAGAGPRGAEDQGGDEEEAARERHAIQRALVEYDLLSLSRRRIPSPLPKPNGTFFSYRAHSRRTSKNSSVLPPFTEYSEEKTRITHAKTEEAHFLGVRLSIGKAQRAQAKVVPQRSPHRMFKRRVTGWLPILKLPSPS
jgi:hypothetical protein